MPVVSQEFKISIGNDPATNAIDEGARAMYLDMLLSDYYGKMVRQGNSFCINGIQASLRPDPAASGIDIGMAVECGVDYIPTTKHSRAAWNNVYRGWRTQKKIDTAIGTQVRYDDMEFGWNKKEGGINRQRTSTIFGQGLSDNEAEKLVLIGASEAGQFPTVPIGTYSLQDYYNSSYETPLPSRNPFTNTNIKDPKWGTTPFPEVQTLRCAATSSAQWFETTGFNQHQGAITESNWMKPPSDSHALCGVLYISAFVMPDDTTQQDEDDFIMTVSISVKSWKALIYSSKPKKSYRRKSKGYKKSYRSRRNYRKGRR